MSDLIEGILTDAGGVPVAGGLGYVYVDGVLATGSQLVDDLGVALANPLTTDAKGYYKAHVTYTTTYSIKWNWLGRERYVEVHIANTGLSSLNASNLTTGTVPAARMPALTGDVTTTIGTVATTIANGAVTLAKQADMATASVVYRKTAGAGPPEVQTLATLKTDLGLTGTNSGDQTITLTGDVTGSGTGSFAATIAGNAVTNAKLATMAAAGLKGATGAGAVSDLTGTQATTLLDTFTSALKGLAPASGGGTTNFLRADGTWAAPAGGGGTTTNAATFNNGGAGAASGATFNGSAAVTISYNTVGATRAGAITAGDLTISTARLAGRTTAATGAIEEISVGANLSLSAGVLNTGATVALLASPTFTGTPAAPTATAGTSTTQIATTAFVNTVSIQSLASSATITPTFSNDMVLVTALAVAAQLANPTGTAQDGWSIVVRIKDNGTARALTYGTQYRAVGVTLPSTTVISKTLYLGMIYNAADTKWDVTSVAQE